MQPKISVFDSTVRNDYVEYEFDLLPSTIKKLKNVAKKEFNTFSELTSIVVYLTQKISSTQVKCSISIFIETNTFGYQEERQFFVDVVLSKVTQIDATFRKHYETFVNSSEEQNKIPFMLGELEIDNKYEFSPF